MRKSMLLGLVALMALLTMSNAWAYNWPDSSGEVDVGLWDGGGSPPLGATWETGTSPYSGGITMAAFYLNTNPMATVTSYYFKVYCARVLEDPFVLTTSSGGLVHCQPPTYTTFGELYWATTSTGMWPDGDVTIEAWIDYTIMMMPGTYHHKVGEKSISNKDIQAGLDDLDFDEASGEDPEEWEAYWNEPFLSTFNYAGEAYNQPFGIDFDDGSEIDEPSGGDYEVYLDDLFSGSIEFESAPGSGSDDIYVDEDPDSLYIADIFIEDDDGGVQDTILSDYPLEITAAWLACNIDGKKRLTFELNDHGYNWSTANKLVVFQGPTGPPQTMSLDGLPEGFQSQSLSVAPQSAGILSAPVYENFSYVGPQVESSWTPHIGQDYTIYTVELDDDQAAWCLPASASYKIGIAMKDDTGDDQFDLQGNRWMADTFTVDDQKIGRYGVYRSFDTAYPGYWGEKELEWIPIMTEEQMQRQKVYDRWQRLKTMMEEEIWLLPSDEAESYKRRWEAANPEPPYPSTSPLPFDTLLSIPSVAITFEEEEGTWEWGEFYAYGMMEGPSLDTFTNSLQGGDLVVLLTYPNDEQTPTGLVLVRDEAGEDNVFIGPSTSYGDVGQGVFVIAGSDSMDLVGDAIYDASDDSCVVIGFDEPFGDDHIAYILNIVEYLLDNLYDMNVEDAVDAAISDWITNVYTPNSATLTQADYNAATSLTFVGNGERYLEAHCNN